MTQVEYVAILFDDCAFSGPQRRDFLAKRYNGRRYSDELTSSELHGLIDHLKDMKAKPLQVVQEDDEC